MYICVDGEVGRIWEALGEAIDQNTLYGNTVFNNNNKLLLLLVMYMLL